MWFGTENGLLRFDGFKFDEWKNTVETPNVLAGDSVHGLYEDSRGDLWLATSGGLSRYDRDSDSFTHVRPDKQTPGKLTHGNLRVITGDREGVIWVTSAGKGLFAFKAGTGESAAEKTFQHFHSKSVEGKLVSDWVHDLFVDKAGTLWIGTLMGLMRREPGGLPESYPLPLSFGRQIITIHEDRSGFLWLGCQNDIIRYDRRRSDARSFRNALSKLPLTGPLYPAAIEDDLDGRIWIATYGNGLLVLDSDSGKLEQFPPDRTAPSAMGSKKLNSLVMDRSGLLWIGSQDKGLFLHNPETRRFGHTILKFPNKDPGDLSISAIYEEDSGELWLGGREGLYKFDRNWNTIAHLEYNPADPRRSLCFGIITTLQKDQRGDMWVGSNGGGISRIPGEGLGIIENFRSVPTDPYSPAHDAVCKIFENRRGELWIGTKGAGLDLFNDGRFVHFRKGPDSIADNTVNDLAEDRKGRLWVATGNGLCYREDGVFKQMLHIPDSRQSIDGKQVFHLYNSRDDSLWASTNRGLNRVVAAGDDFSFTHYGEKDGIRGKIMGILEDRAGNLWISTSRSLLRFNPERRLSRTYGTRDGMQSDSFIDGAAFSRPGGRLFFGGETGFNSFDPADIKDNTLPPPVFITNLQLFKRTPAHQTPDSPITKPISRTEKIELDYRENFLTLEFAALDYAAPERNRYAYRMEGLHDDWRYTGGDKNNVVYANMAPGDYIFHVKGSNRDGYWQEAARRLNISITPPPWATRWAYAFYILVLVLLATAYVRTWKKRLNRERRINEDLDRKVAERTHDLEARNREVLQQQQKLREMDQLKNRFFTNLSHEFRTPLTLMLGPLEDLLNMNQMSPEKMKGTIQAARHHSLRLLEMVNELLDVSKLEAGQMRLQAREADLAAFLALCAAPFQATGQKEDRLILKLPEHPVPVYFDPDKLTKIFSNLIMNALKHIPDDGRIAVVMKDEDTRVSIDVQDNGPGIPADKLEHIFDRFYQAESTKTSNGTGIGLSLARELVALHGGEITVVSREGFGCTFTVTLHKGREHLDDNQLVSDESEAVPEGTENYVLNVPAMSTPPEVATSPENKDRLSVLVIEDHEEIQSYLYDILHQHYEVSLAGTGELGLAHVMEHIPDLLICDLMLPDMDGLDICRKVKEEECTSHIPIIVLTARTTAKQNIEGLEAGADAYLTKPFSSEVLLSQIRNLIRNRRLLQDRFSHKITAAAAEVDVHSYEEDFLLKTVSIMEARLQEQDFGVNELADELGLSRRQLHRKLTAITGKTPSEVFRDIRLGRAAQLLRQNTDQVAQIAYTVGFSQRKHFSKLFREAYGRTPSEYAAHYRRLSSVKPR
ncbi:MAG: two-component regulator propeller domain-containing protein [Acidobacteriota bacterium]|nr:two-component regulator propeller domain-containing protein [Acidobacteriota bacterium]